MSTQRPRDDERCCDFAERPEQIKAERDELREEIRARNLYLTDAGLQREANAVTVARLKAVIAGLQKRIGDFQALVARMNVEMAQLKAPLDPVDPHADRFATAAAGKIVTLS
jgi:chromosome segregation ATPase